MKRVAKHLLSLIAGLFGRQLFIVKSNNGSHQLFDLNSLISFWNQDDAVAGYHNSMHATGMSWSDNLSKRFRYYTLHQMTNLALDRNLGKGDIAECGCWRGHSAHMIATILEHREFSNKFLLFDSFEGLSDLAAPDQNQRYALTARAIEHQRDVFAASEDLVRANLVEFEFMEFYPGWIPERFQEVSDRQFILVNIDVDLYQPTRDSVEFFLPRLVDGGVMIFNDYGFTQFPGAKAAVDEAVAEMKSSLFYVGPSGGAFLIK